MFLFYFILSRGRPHRWLGTIVSFLSPDGVVAGCADELAGLITPHASPPLSAHPLSALSLPLSSP